MDSHAGLSQHCLSVSRYCNLTCVSLGFVMALWQHFSFGELLGLLREERRREEEEEEEEGEENSRYGLLWISMDFWTFVWILVCSISRV